MAFRKGCKECKQIEAATLVSLEHAVAGLVQVADKLAHKEMENLLEQEFLRHIRLAVSHLYHEISEAAEQCKVQKKGVKLKRTRMSR